MGSVNKLRCNEDMAMKVTSLGQTLLDIAVLEVLVAVVVVDRLLAREES